MKENSAHQLNVKRPQTKRAARRFAAIGKGLWQKRVQRFAFGNPLAKLFSLFNQPGVAERFKFGFERGDLVNERPCRLDLAVIRRSEDLFGDR